MPSNLRTLVPRSTPGVEPTLASYACGFSYILDAAAGRADGHALRTCILGMKIGRRAGLPPHELEHLFYALLFKDLGADGELQTDLEFRRESGKEASLLWRYGMSSLPRRRIPFAAGSLVSANMSWSGLTDLLDHGTQARLHRRREQKASRACAFRRALDLGLSRDTAEAISQVDAQWNGKGVPEIRGVFLSLLAQIVKLAEMLAGLHEVYGVRESLRTVYHRFRGWFDPGLIAATMLSFQWDESWRDLQPIGLAQLAAEQDPSREPRRPDARTIDRFCHVISEVVDSRSQHMARHSSGVTQFALRIGEFLALPETQMHTLKRAALLHDVGTLRISPALLDKPGPLHAAERAQFDAAPEHTRELLSRIPEFGEVAMVAALHRERLDGSGAPHGLKGEAIGLLSRILAVADVSEALAAGRAYRPKHTAEDIHKIVAAMTPHALDPMCVAALRSPQVRALVA